MQMSDASSFFQLQSNRLFSIDTPLKGGQNWYWSISMAMKACLICFA